MSYDQELMNFFCLLLRTTNVKVWFKFAQLVARLLDPAVKCERNAEKRTVKN